MKKRHIIVGMSGGVDSAVAALLLSREGHLVEGLFMKNWEEDDSENYCAAEQDLRDAQAICEHLGFPLHTVNFSHEYWERVFEYFLSEYKSGRTPNPDVMCNKEIKFKAFLDYALALGADYIATGHYARRKNLKGTWSLCKGLDQAKDQTYFLYPLGQRALSQSLFPVGHLIKARVREIARAAGIQNHAKKDSTGICFIGERRFRNFLARYLDAYAQRGEIVTEHGECIGYHAGLMFYTIGQRQGIGIGGRANTTGEPWYVVKKDTLDNRLIVVQGHMHPSLYNKGLLANQLHWISGQAPSLPFQCTAKIRYRQSVQTCDITSHSADGYRVIFEQPQRAITPGQAVVFYQDDQCLGGGIILKPIED